MRPTPFITAVPLFAFLCAPLAVSAGAEPLTSSGAPPASALRASIAREAVRAAQAPAAPVRVPSTIQVRRQGGGGGGGMMLMTLIMTAAGIAGTYFMVKELRKSNDTKENQQ